MAKGDHIYVNQSFRGIPFQHHGIDMGDGSVVHLAPEKGSRLGFSSSSGTFSVRRDSMEDFCAGKRVHVVKHAKPLGPDEIVAAAEAALGQGAYHLVDNNCEHFATQCVTGVADSRQVELSHSAAVSCASAVTKGIWAISGRFVSRTAAKVASRPHPLSILADGVEVVASASGCMAGLSAEKTRGIAKASGELTALAVGCVVGGPVGGAVSLAMHRSSNAVAEHFCSILRQGLTRLKG